MKLLPRQLHWRILLGILAGAIIGLFLNQTAQEEIVFVAVPILDLISGIFLRLLRMIVVPLVAASVFIGVTSVGSSAILAKIGYRTGAYYLLTSLIAIVTGLVFVNLLRPGVGANVDMGDMTGSEVATPDSVIDLILRVIPTNPVQALATYDMLGIIFFMIFLGVFTLRVGADKTGALQSFMQNLYDISIAIVEFVIKLAPIGVLCLVAKLVQSTGVDVFIPLMKYVVTATLALAFHMFVNLQIIYYLVTHKSPFQYMSRLAPALLTAFSSASSAATLPLTMSCAEKGGVNPKTTSLVLPLGATVNMDGTALYEGLAVLFIAQVLGVELTLFQQMVVLLTALMVSIGAAGIPHAGLVMMVIILDAVGLPIEATGMIWAVDRVVDMMRTSVNVWSDAVCAAIIDNVVDHEETDQPISA